MKVGRAGQGRRGRKKGWSGEREEKERGWGERERERRGESFKI